MKRATIYLEPHLHRALKMKAAETDQTVSVLVNRAVEEALAEDLEDLDSLRKRAGGPTETYEAFISGLRADGAL